MYKDSKKLYIYSFLLYIFRFFENFNIILYINIIFCLYILKYSFSRAYYVEQFFFHMFNLGSLI